MTKKAPYGYCPICSCEGETRERRLDGDDRCQEGHTYPSRRALAAPKAVAPAAPELPHQHQGDTAAAVGNLIYALEAWKATSPTTAPPAFAAMVKAASDLVAAAAPAAPTGEPVAQEPAEPLKGWKLNHVQRGEEEGTAEIGYLDPEDDRFARIVTVDTGLYYQDDQAIPLAVAILGALENAAAPVERQPLSDEQWLKARTAATGQRLRRNHDEQERAEFLRWTRWVESACAAAWGVKLAGGADKGGAA